MTYKKCIANVKTSIHLSRSNGYRELGMYDESILELEEIEGEDRWGFGKFDPQRRINLR